jgi:hypothetical protein
MLDWLEGRATLRQERNKSGTSAHDDRSVMFRDITELSLVLAAVTFRAHSWPVSNCVATDGNVGID